MNAQRPDLDDASADPLDYLAPLRAVVAGEAVDYADLPFGAYSRLAGVVRLTQGGHALLAALVALDASGTWAGIMARLDALYPADLVAPDQILDGPGGRLIREIRAHAATRAERDRLAALVASMTGTDAAAGLTGVDASEAQPGSPHVP